MSNRDWKWIITLIVAIAGIFSSSFFAYQNYELQKQNLELSKPYIIKMDLITRSKIQNVDFPIYIRNPSNNEYTIDLSKGTCSFETNFIHKYIPEKNKTIDNIIIPNLGNEVIINPHSLPKMTSLNPNTTIHLQCSGFSIDQTINDTYTFMNVCVKFTTFKDTICERIPIKILKSRIININGTVN